MSTARDYDPSITKNNEYDYIRNQINKVQIKLQWKYPEFLKTKHLRSKLQQKVKYPVMSNNWIITIKTKHRKVPNIAEDWGKDAKADNISSDNKKRM